MIEACAVCGANLALVGKVHRCAPSSSCGLGVHQPGSKEPGGGDAATARPGKARDRVKRPAAAGSNPEAKATKGKVGSAGSAKGARKTTVNPPEGVASRLRAGRTAQDGGVKLAVAIPKRGRPRKPDDAPVSRATLYRRKAEGKL